MKKLKILEVLDCYRPSVDGPILCLENYSKCLREMFDADVDLMVPAYPKFKDEENSNIYRIFSAFGFEGYRLPMPIFSRKARKLFKKNKYDIVHFHSPFTMGRFAVKWAKKYKIPCVCTVHTQYKDDFESRLKSKFLQNFMMKYITKTINLADTVLTVSNGARDIIKKYGIVKDMVVLRNGTDLKYPSNDVELIDLVNKKYNLKDEKNVFLFVGRVVENKNIQFSLKVLKLLKQRGHDFKFIIVGSGAYENTLKKLIEEYDLTNNVVFTGLIRGREELSGLYLRSDMFLFPSTFDTFGLVVLEAATMKTPTFAIKGTCAAECINDEINGLCDVEDENVWANKLEKYIGNKELIKNISESAYNTIYSSWEDVTAELYKIYLKTIEEYNNNANQNNKKVSDK